MHAGEMLPVLFVVFLLMEAVSHSARLSWVSGAMRRPVAGPAAAAFLGLLPQCGFSVAATVLWGRGMVTTGSLIATYIATSDEAIPVLFSDPSTMRWVLPLMAAKFAWAVIVGSLVNLAYMKRRKATQDGLQQPEPRRARSASCVGESAGWKEFVSHALSRTARITAMIFVLSSAFNLAGDLAGPGMAQVLPAHGVWQPLAASVFGLVPSCATSVALAEGFRAGFVSFPALLSGLTSNAGLGILALAKEAGGVKRTFSVLSILVLAACAAGVLAKWFLPV